MRRCVDRSGRRTSAGDVEVLRLHLLTLVNRQIQEDQRKAKMDNYELNATIVLFFAIVGLFFFAGVSIALASEFFQWLKKIWPRP